MSERTIYFTKICFCSLQNTSVCYRLKICTDWACAVLLKFGPHHSCEIFFCVGFVGLLKTVKFLGFPKYRKKLIPTELFILILGTIFWSSCFTLPHGPIRLQAWWEGGRSPPSPPPWGFTWYYTPRWNQFWKKFCVNKSWKFF